MHRSKDERACLGSNTRCGGCQYMSDMWSRALVGFLFSAGCTAGSFALADEPRGRLFIGGSLAHRSTTDEIRSNALISFGSLGADGIPFTFDPGETEGCLGSDPNILTCDVRPDILIESDTVIQEAYQGEIHAGYSLAKWLSVQLDAAYYKANVG